HDHHSCSKDRTRDCVKTNHHWAKVGAADDDFETPLSFFSLVSRDSADRAERIPPSQLPFLFYRVLVLQISFDPALFCRLFPFLILSLLIVFVLFPALTLAQWWLVLMQSLVLSLPTIMMVLLCPFLAPPRSVFS